MFSSFFPTEEAPNEMEVEDGEDGASAGRGEGGADAPAAHARPSEHTAAPARPASASAITAIVLALGDAARAEQQRGPGGGSTDDAAGAGSEGQQGSGTHLAGQVAVAGDGASESGAFTSPRLPSTVHDGGRSSTRAR